MAIIAIYSVKGGVGKTTLSANLAWCASAISRRETLLWDLDPSGGGGYLLNVEPKKHKHADGLFTGRLKAADIIRNTAHDRLDVLPGDESLRKIGRILAKTGKRKLLSKIGAGLQRDYDRIILDCPPVMNELSAQIMRAADLVIVPLPPSPLSTRAFAQVQHEMKAATFRHPPILPVLSMLDMRRTLHREARDAAPDWPAIPFSSAAEQCAVRQLPAGIFAPRSTASVSFARLWRAIERKLAAIA